MQLDLEQTTVWLSASADIETQAALAREASYDNTNNQMILQLMHERVLTGKSMLPNWMADNCYLIGKEDSTGHI